MLEMILMPPIAFGLYLALAWLLSRGGQWIAAQSDAQAESAEAYASGEAAPLQAASPGYRPFFRIALFFAVLHLGVLVLATGGLQASAALYIAGLLVILVALLLG
jgi:NADH:ubiquinone oxidoreductase subunit 3 (subunit A)